MNLIQNIRHILNKYGRVTDNNQMPIINSLQTVRSAQFEADVELNQQPISILWGFNKIYPGI